MAGLRERLHHRHKGVRHLTKTTKILPEGTQLIGGWQLSVEKQPCDFLVGAVGGQFLDRVPTVLQDASLAIDEADGGLGGGDAGKAGDEFRR